MRNWIVASLLGHVVFLACCAVLASLITPKAPALDVIKVDLAQIDFPREEAPKPKPEPPKPEPPKPEIPEPPQELARKVPEPEPDSLRAKELEIVREIPEPKLDPPKPVEQSKSTPKPVETLDLPEPAQVESSESEPSDVDETADEAISQDTSMRMRAPEGMADYYFALLRRKIARRWDPDQASAQGRRGVEAVIAFRVGSAGQILDAEVRSGSGLSVFDRKCLAAVLAANPLPAPPHQYLAAGSLPIELIFTYNP